MTAITSPSIDRSRLPSPWSQLLQRLRGSSHVARARTVLQSLTGQRTRLPLYRITRVWTDRWVVMRPGGTMEHAFATLDEAVAFVRHEAGPSRATVELFIGDLYVAAYHDPDKPVSLFGERL